MAINTEDCKRSLKVGIGVVCRIASTEVDRNEVQFAGKRDGEKASPNDVLPGVGSFPPLRSPISV